MPFEAIGLEPLTEKVNIRLTMAEKHSIQEDADIAGLTMSELIRRKCLGRPILTNADMALIKELRRIGGILSAFDREESEAFIQLRQVLERVSDRDREGS